MNLGSCLLPDTALPELADELTVEALAGHRVPGDWARHTVDGGFFRDGGIVRMDCPQHASLDAMVIRDGPLVLARRAFSPVHLGPGDSIQFTWEGLP